VWTWQTRLVSTVPPRSAHAEGGLAAAGIEAVAAVMTAATPSVMIWRAMRFMA
jgi:hypothetical protein